MACGLCYLRLLTEALVPYLSYTLSNIHEVAAHDNDVFGQQFCNGDESGAGTAQFGHQGHRFTSAAAKLALHFEGADTVHLVAEEIDTIRQFMRERIDVDERTANGKLPGLVDIIGALEAELEKRLFDELQVNLLPYPNLQRALV